MNETLAQQFSGFLQTPQIWDQIRDFPYPPFHLKKVNGRTTPDLKIPPTWVLGKRMEAFFKCYIENYTEERILAYNEQIIHEKQTLGELDFLLENESSGAISHVELAYKFYLFDPNIPPGEGQWTGPNHKDSLIRKLYRLREKQFPLLHKPETEPLLKRIGVHAGRIDQKICFKANLFLPWERNTPFKAPPGAQGRWIRQKEFSGPPFTQALFYSPRKPEWPILPVHNTRWFPFEETCHFIRPFLENKQSPLLWMKDKEGHFHRLFVVWWPENQPAPIKRKLTGKPAVIKEKL